jgi:hypothetical protein
MRRAKSLKRASCSFVQHVQRSCAAPFTCFTGTKVQILTVNVYFSARARLRLGGTGRERHGRERHGRERDAAWSARPRSAF